MKNAPQKHTRVATEIQNPRFRLSVLLVVVTFGLMPANVGHAEEDRQVQLKVSHWVPPSHPLQEAIENWLENIRKASNGTITSVIFPAELLGKAVDHYDLVSDGEASVAFVSPGYEPGRYPIIAAADLPFLYHDAESGTAAVDVWYRKYAPVELSDVHYCFAFIHAPGTLHSRKRLVTPEDMKGLRIRQPNATMGRFIGLLKASGLNRSASESRELLERGEADGIFFPWGSTVLFGIDKVTSYDIDADFYASTFLWLINRAIYTGMSPSQKQVIDDHCTTEWAVKFASQWADFEEAGRTIVQEERRKAPGHGSKNFIELTPDQLDQWRQAAEPLRELWAEDVRKVGLDPYRIWREFQDSLAEHHAGYNLPEDDRLRRNGAGQNNRARLDGDAP